MTKAPYLLILFFFCAVARAETTNQAYVAWRGTDSWHIAMFDVDYQLQRAAAATNRVNWSRLSQVRAWVDGAANTTQKMQRLQLVVNRALGAADDWNPCPQWRFAGNQILDVRYGLIRRGATTNEMLNP